MSCSLNELSGPDGSRHSSDQHPKDVNSENLTYCLEFVSRNVCPPEGQVPRSGISVFFAVFEFLSHLPRNSRASRGRKFRSFCLFCLLWPQVAQGLFEGTCAHVILRRRSSQSESEACGPTKFQEKRSRSEKAILEALGEFLGTLGGAPGVQRKFSG